MILAEAKQPIIFLNDKYMTLNRTRVISPPAKIGDSYITWTIGIDAEIKGALRVAETTGGGLSFGGGASEGNPLVFAGFKGIRVGPGREKLDRVLSDCPY
jgi:hypothetical protein